MSNTLRTRPPLTGPPPPDAALHLAAALSVALERAAVPWQPGCATCVRRARVQQSAHPTWDLPPIQQAVTWQDGQPVCFGDFELGDDGQPVSTP